MGCVHNSEWLPPLVARASSTVLKSRKNLGWFLRQPNRRFVITDAFDRDLHQNESDVEVGYSEDEHCQDDRRSVASREDFLAYEFRALVVQPGFHAIPGALPGVPSHG